MRFLDYLCRNVAYTLPKQVYQRVVDRIPHAWETIFPSKEGQDTEFAVHPESPEEFEARVRSEEDRGIYYGIPHLLDRGVFVDVEKVEDGRFADKESEGICHKNFSHSPGQTCACTYTYTNTHMHTHTYTICIFSYTYTYTCTYTQTCIHAHNSHTHTNIHTHTTYTCIYAHTHIRSACFDCHCCA